MNQLAPADERMLHRFVDGELTDAATDECRRRLEQEPALRQRLQELQAIRGCFRAAAPVAGAPAGFTDNLLAAVRQRTLTQTWRDDEHPNASRLCRRLLLAAALLVVGAGIWRLGLFRPHTPSVVEASNELRQLDRMIDAEAAPAATRENRK